MARLPNIKDTIIATGYNCQVRIGRSETDCEMIAMVTSFQANEDFQVQEAVVLNNLGPISLDPQGYTCSITLDGFLPSKGKLSEMGGQVYEDGGTTAIADHVPSRAQFMQGEGVPTKFEYLDFYNKRDNAVICRFSGVIITSNGVSVEGNSYARNNVQMRALSWNKD